MTEESLKPLTEIHKKEYPVPESELRHIVEQSIQTLGKIAERVKRLKDTLPEDQRLRCDNFLFYYTSLLEKKVSPFYTLAYFNVGKDGRIFTTRRYLNDIAIWPYSAFGWKIYEESDSVPHVVSNNFWTNFQYSSSINNRYTKNVMIREIKGCLIDEHKDRFLEIYENKEFLIGDEKFGKSIFKLSLIEIRNDVYYDKIKQPSDEEIEKLRLALNDRSLVGRINFEGQEIMSGKTHFEVWEEFKIQEQDLFERLVTICKEPYDENGEFKPELYPLLPRAYTILVLNGAIKSEIIR